MNSSMATASRISVGPFVVADVSRQELTEMIVTSRGKRVALALHVGGLNCRKNRDYVDAMSRADVTYADGVSVVGLARLGGAARVQNAPTTDVGWDILRGVGTQIQRQVRIAIVGGKPGVAKRAGEALEASAPVTVVSTIDGYREEYDSYLASLGELSVDVLIVGLGMPNEALWVKNYLARIPDCLVLTCGGWLGFLEGSENRAPLWMRRMSLEWLFRLMGSPRRLLPRYAHGTATVLRLAVWQVLKVRRSSEPPAD